MLESLIVGFVGIFLPSINIATIVFFFMHCLGQFIILRHITDIVLFAFFHILHEGMLFATCFPEVCPGVWFYAAAIRLHECLFKDSLSHLHLTLVSLYFLRMPDKRVTHNFFPSISLHNSVYSQSLILTSQPLV